MNYRLYGTIVFLLVIAVFINQSANSLSYDATNVTTRVNITQAYPEILNITLPEGIILNEGTNKTVTCNVTIRDYNGYNDVTEVNATFFHNLTSYYNDTDDMNFHYSNDSCSFQSNSDAYTGLWFCSFDVAYFANNGTWDCYVEASDNYGFSTNGTGNGTINPLYAINVTSLIDYGNMAVGDTSTSSELANITNFGNMDLNISVYGYGGTDPIAGDGLAFICAVGNISVENERYSVTDQAWATMDSLTSVSSMIPGLTIVQQTDDLVQEINSTYWRLYVPPNPFGQCNGTVVFEAELP